MNYLFVVTEFDIVILYNTALELTRDNPSVFVDLYVVDKWSLKYNIQYLKKLRESTPANISIIIDTTFEDIQSPGKPNMEFLRIYDQDRRRKFGINQLLRHEYALATDFHVYRNFLYPWSLAPSDEYKYYTVEKYIRSILNLFDTKKYDLVFFIKVQGMEKAIVYNECGKRDILCISCDGARIDKGLLFSDTFTIGPPTFMRNCEPSTEDREFIESLANSIQPSYSDHYLVLKSFLTPKLFRFLKYIFWTIKSEPKRIWYTLKNDTFKLKYLMPSMISNIVYQTRTYIRIFRQSRMAKYVPLDSDQYIYFPLHFMPESNTVAHCHSLSQLDAIKQLSLMVPAGLKILVKHPPASLDINGHTLKTTDITSILEIPSVRLVNPTYSSRLLTRKCKAVACLAGTSLIEGLIEGKPGIRWGNPEFSHLPYIYEFKPDSFYISDIIDSHIDLAHAHHALSSYLAFIRANSTSFTYTDLADMFSKSLAENNFSPKTVLFHAESLARSLYDYPEALCNP